MRNFHGETDCRIVGKDLIFSYIWKLHASGESSSFASRSSEIFMHPIRGCGNHTFTGEGNEEIGGCGDPMDLGIPGEGICSSVSRRHKPVFWISQLTEPITLIGFASNCTIRIFEPPSPLSRGGLPINCDSKILRD